MTEIERPDQPTALEARMRYARALAASTLLPRAYRDQPANILVAVEYGRALGLEPMVAIQTIHVVDGKPTASAQLIGSLVRRAGHRLRVTGDKTHARAEIIRSDDPEFAFVSEWTLERAKSAGLLGKTSWAQYPDAMLKARAITEVARDACPEVLAGVAYTAEELGQDTPQDSPQSRTAGTSEPEVQEAEIIDEAPTDHTPRITPHGGSYAATDKQCETLRSAFRKLAAHHNITQLRYDNHVEAILSDFTGSPVTYPGHVVPGATQLTKRQAADVLDELLKNPVGPALTAVLNRYVDTIAETADEELPDDLGDDD